MKSVDAVKTIPVKIAAGEAEQADARVAPEQMPGAAIEFEIGNTAVKSIRLKAKLVRDGQGDAGAEIVASEEFMFPPA